MADPRARRACLRADLGAQLDAKFGAMPIKSRWSGSGERSGFARLLAVLPSTGKARLHHAAASTSVIDALVDAARNAGASFQVGAGRARSNTRRRHVGCPSSTTAVRPSPVDAVIVHHPLSDPCSGSRRRCPPTYKQICHGSPTKPRRSRSSKSTASSPISTGSTSPIRDMPFTGVIEHTNFMPPADYDGKHYVYLSKYMEPDHPYFTMPEDELIKTYLPYLKRINPDFDASWIRTLVGLPRASRATDRHPQLQRETSRPPHAAQEPLPCQHQPDLPRRPRHELQRPPRQPDRGIGRRRIFR